MACSVRNTPSPGSVNTFESGGRCSVGCIPTRMLRLRPRHVVDERHQNVRAVFIAALSAFQLLHEEKTVERVDSVGPEL